MRKLFSTLLCGVMLFGFFACEEPIDRDGQTSTTFTVTLLVNDSTMGTVSGTGTYESGDTVTVTATANSGYEFIRWNDDVTTNPRKIVVTEDICLTAIFEEQTPIDFNGHAYVDLGLPSGTLWATCNVGATNPEDYGDYFAWGETKPKEIYSWDTYKYGTYNYDRDYSKLTKYNKTDGKMVLEAADDAATVNWGGDWRMPTKAEQDELRTKCTWTCITLNGEEGYEIKGTNGNSIFLPTTGFRNNSDLGYSWADGYYWSSSLDSPSNAWNIHFHSTGGHQYLASNRYYGSSVRPVCSPR